MCSYDNKVKLIEGGNVELGDDGEFVFNIRCMKGRPTVEFVNIGKFFFEFQIVIVAQQSDYCQKIRIIVILVKS